MALVSVIEGEQIEQNTRKNLSTINLKYYNRERDELIADVKRVNKESALLANDSPTLKQLRAAQLEMERYEVDLDNKVREEQNEMQRASARAQSADQAISQAIREAYSYKLAG